jgi:hypothetical protein
VATRPLSVTAPGKPLNTVDRRGKKRSRNSAEPFLTRTAT